MRPTEDEFIARYFAPLATHPGAEGLRDDAALLVPQPGRSLVVTADALVEGVHFLADDPAGDIARKALRVNLSDLAAKGARPEGFLLSLALPPDWRQPWIDDFARGLGADCAEFGITLLGGDTVRTPGPLSLCVTAIGSVAGDVIPRRGGARAGDHIYVSGTIGDGALGLVLRLGRDAVLAEALDAADRDHLVGRYRLPQPRCALAPAVLAHASAAMDVSDGLVGDLAKLLAASGVSARIALDAVPLSRPARKALAAMPGMIETIATGGDDYEILATVPPGEAAAFEAMAAASGIPVAMIGGIVEGRGPPLLLDGEGARRHFARSSFSHF